MNTSIRSQTATVPLEEEPPRESPPFPRIPRPDFDGETSDVDDPCPEWPTDDRVVVAVTSGASDPFAGRVRVVRAPQAVAVAREDAAATMPLPLPEPEPVSEAEADRRDEPRAPVLTAACPLAGNRAPVYPRRALEEAWSGAVELRLLVDAAGQVRRAEVVTGSGHACLDDAAVRAARAWRFDPATCDGAPVESVVLQTVRFTF